MPASKKLSTAIIGAAGEHLVMGELLRRGHIAALAPQGAPNMDVLIADDRGERMFSIQVKTRTQAARVKGWPMHKKHESIAGKRLFHVFVDLSKPLGEVPDYFVIPFEIVAKVVRETHAAWVRNPGRKGQQRSLTNDMRSIQSDYASVYTVEEPGFVLGWLDEFKESWHYFDP